METTRILISFCLVTVILAAGVVGKWILTNFLLTSLFYCKYFFHVLKIAPSRHHLLSKELPWFIQRLNFNFLRTFFLTNGSLDVQEPNFFWYMYIQTKKQILIYLDQQKGCIPKKKVELSISLLIGSPWYCFSQPTDGAILG